MTIIPHAIAGATATLFTNNIYVAFLLGIVSHFVTDALPHLEPKSLVIKTPDGRKQWKPGLFIFAGVEFSLTILVFLSQIHRPDFWVMASGAFGGLLPDMIVNNPFLQKYKDLPGLKYLFLFHAKIHLDVPLKFWYISLLVEGIVVIGLLWLILIK